MSLARFDTDAPSLPGASPRVSLAHARAAREHYHGAREPKHRDELGAIAVVDALWCGDPSHHCGDRFAFFRISGTEQCEVRTLPRVPPT